MKGKVYATKGGHFRYFHVNAWRLMPPGRYGWVEAPEEASWEKPKMPDELIEREYMPQPEVAEVEPVTEPAPTPVTAPRAKKNPATATKRGGKRARRTKQEE